VGRSAVGPKMPPGILLALVLAGFPLARGAPPLSTDDAEVLKSFFRIQQIVKRINIAGVLSQPPDATLEADTSISANINNGGTENKTDAESDEPLETEQNTEDPGQGTTVSLGENKEFPKDESLMNPTTSMPTETEETTQDLSDYDFPQTAYPMYVLPVDYSYSDTDMDSDPELVDLQEEHPTKISTQAEELEILEGATKANSDEDEMLSNSQDADSEEVSVRVGFTSGSELTKVDSLKTFRIALLALK